MPYSGVFLQKFFISVIALFWVPYSGVFRPYSGLFRPYSDVFKPYSDVLVPYSSVFLKKKF